MPLALRKYVGVANVLTNAARSGKLPLDHEPRRVVGRKYKTVEEQGLRFVFAYDDDAPDLLHICVRHRRRA